MFLNSSMILMIKYHFLILFNFGRKTLIIKFIFFIIYHIINHMYCIIIFNSFKFLSLIPFRIRFNILFLNIPITMLFPFFPKPNILLPIRPLKQPKTIFHIICIMSIIYFLIRPIKQTITIHFIIIKLS